MGAEMNTTEVLDLCKRGEIAQADAYAALCKFAEAQRKPGRTIAQGFSDYIQKDEIGQRLFAAYKALPGSPFDMNSPDRLSATDRGVPVAKVADTDWSELVKLYAKSYGLTEGAAISQMLATADGMAMFRKQMKAERLRNPDFSGLDHQQEDVYEAAREEQRVAKANTELLPFQQKVRDMRARFPNMSESDALDHARSLYPDEWKKFKELGLDADPQDGAISGRPDPSRAPIWQGEQTSSNLTPPPKVEVMEPPNPKFKRDQEIAVANWDFFVDILKSASEKAGKNWDRDQCTSILKRCPAARQYLDAALAG
jgi:hypothetical protein